MARKRDADRIVQHLADLPAELRLDTGRAWWPTFAFHFTDIQNVPSILRSGKLLSRERVQQSGTVFTDGASRDIIAQSEHAHKYVRLYFRPRTPTQYRNEGIRPRDNRERNSHCPVPVFFLFTARDLLATEGVNFTNGNLARRRECDVGEDADFFEQLPFELIYHDSYIPNDPSERDRIIFHRHAEIIVEDELPLTTLKHVVCRTGAERDTLLHLLPDSVRNAWAEHITIERPNAPLFYHRGIYVRRATLLSDRIEFDSPVMTLGAYTIKVTVWEPGRRVVIAEREKTFSQYSRFSGFSLPKAPERVEVRVLIEGDLAYHGVISRQSLYG